MTLFIIIKAIFLLQVFNCVTGDVTCLASNCICKTLSAVCTGNNLTYIPRFPQTIWNVTIKNANLSRISENSYVPNLKTLHLNSNYISLLSTFKCLPSLSFLSLQDNSIDKIPEEAFSNLFSLKELNLKSAGNRIKRIKRKAFNLSSLETLMIGECFYHFDQLNSSALLQFFALVPNLQILNMENNPLPRDTHSMSLLFKPISKIRKLHLDSCKLYQLR